MSKFKIAACVTLALTLSACATDDPNRRAKTGALIGAVAGGVLGKQVSGARGAPIVGAAIGAIAGGAVGGYMDKQAAELKRQLAAEQARQELNITQLSDGSLKIGIASDVSFDVDSAQLKSAALNTYAKIAQVLQTYDMTVIHIIGHTDSTGSDQYNQGLSERRAASVASYMGAQGLSMQRVRQEGRGESQPIADNNTVDGRTRNRRVDIVIKPVVEGREQEAWTPPPYLGA
ncbi:OmpA family protein [Sinimarinibacterium sp. NLF-5-8]|uniref:OmpA family protein n=1 Tax=Sinimarinibacterium sp. NLF-5-8 TaxID=2698684 RepID=UPI00137BB27C|nr:OmpA family protein [Sinimarinibacterium sp. NLF-5-8]QHS09938.1 OmpA family protein [Sinimarinibacterium sp. NLF-5-8]